jgi:hypothetical protein
MSTREPGTSILSSPDSFEDCYARFTDGELAIGNRHVERRWQVRNGLLYPISLRDLSSGREWLASQADSPAPTPHVALVEEAREVQFETRRGQFGPTQEESLVVDLRARGRSQELQYRFQVFPSARGVTAQLCVTSQPEQQADIAGLSTAEQASGVEIDAVQTRSSTAPATDVLEHLALAAPHYRLVQVTLRDQTDAYNELA